MAKKKAKSGSIVADGPDDSATAVMAAMGSLHLEISKMATCLEKSEQRRAFNVILTTFAPEPFEMLKDVPVVVEQDGEDYTASFYDANLHGVGSNETEAIDSLKENILSAFDYLDAQDPARLVVPLRRQIQVLRQFVRRNP